jgi:RHS repeat-associated protein
VPFRRSIAGEVTSITNATYQNLPYNPPNLVSNVVNGPDGPVSYTLGNGLTGYRSYDSLGRLSGQWVCNGPAAAECSGGTQIYGTTSAWKGVQMQEQNDTVLNQQVTLGYDGFNRLTARTVTSGTVQNYTYAYDRYGNRTQTALQTGYNFSPTYSASTNHITSSGYAYDAAGNMTNDTFHTYTYDAEGNITKVDGGSTATYVYDVFNRRIHVQTASATTEFAYDYAGRRVSSWLSPNNYGNEGRIYWDGQQVAYRSTDGTTYFDQQDILGTERLRSNYAGSVGSSYVSLPLGDGYTATVNSSGADQDNAHFADLERDAESGTEHAQFRNYTSRQGRWLAPDQYTGSYDATNPQSMNRYAYVLNNPMSLFDPSGLGPGDGDDTVENPDDTAGNSLDCSSGTTVCVTATPSPAIPVTIPDPCSFVPCLSADGGDGTGPANPGNPYIFRISVIGTQIANLVLQRTRLLTIPFGPSGQTIGASGVALSNPATPTPVCYQGGCVLPGGPPLLTKQQIKQAAKTYLCGSSPADNVKNWMIEGTVKGLVFGAVAGGITGTVVGTPVGSAVGAVTGGVIDGAIGGASGVIWGSIASWACSAAGAY